VVAGLLLLGAAAGLRRAMTSTWVPRLTAVSGAGMIAAGVLVMDPMADFPAGGQSVPATMSWHSIGHMVAGSITFIALIAACYVLVRYYRSAGRPGLAGAAAVSGTALLAGDLWAMTGGAGGTLTLAAGAITAMLFLSATAFRLRRASS
jgi:hypothetical protein